MHTLILLSTRELGIDPSFTHKILWAGGSAPDPGETAANKHEDTTPMELTF